MKINTILKNPERSLLYMERIVNDGSPSGFSFVNTTSKQTCPQYTNRFYLRKIVDNKERFITIGDSDLLRCYQQYDWIYIHPDWSLYDSNLNIQTTNKIVCPTASSRTVKPLNDQYYIKMAYPGVLGRITRELGLKHIYSSIDVNEILCDLVTFDDSPSKLAFLPEIGGKCYCFNEHEIGFVLRDSKPVGKNVKDIIAQIPAFSIFSVDKLNIHDSPIIIQLLQNKNNYKKFLFEELVFPIIDCYFYCIFRGGIQPEMHSQNFLIGIDENYNINSIILRDLESMDKDISIMKNIRPIERLKSYPYKCIWKEQYNYKIKHSFMYDHKLGEYFIEPLLNCLHKNDIIHKGQAQKIIKSYVLDKYQKVFVDFFPDNGCWYKFDSVVIDRSRGYRPYLSFPNPKYR